MGPRYRFAFDTGGTFTDMVLLCEDTGQVYIGKLPSTPDRPALAVVEGFERLLERAAVDIARSDVFVFGATTLVANSLIEKKGARTALVTTHGFRDILEMRREMRYDLYDLQLEFPEPLVPRELRYEIKERLDKDGSVIVPIDAGEVKRVVRELAKQSIESVAICFLHSYKNAQHEKDVAGILSEELTGVSLTLSSELIPEIREYERTSTTVANAYVKPLMRKHVEELRSELAARGAARAPYFMLSSGGMVGDETAERFPIRVAESGPAAGVLAAGFYGARVGRYDLLSFDMGGTTAKLGLVSGGRPAMTTDFEVARAHRFKKGSGLPLKIPVIEMIEIGAGGGSIAYVDEKLGLLKVGPESAGAKPGPACYKWGGQDPTVTDADLILGYLNPSFFLGGKMTLDVDLAEKAARTRIASGLRINTVTAASGIYDIVNENMIKAAKVYIAERGKDPRALTLVAFGGAGPIHARKVAKGLGIATVLVPPRAGVASAVGLLVAPVAIDAVRSYVTRLECIDWHRLNRIYKDMWEEASVVMEQAGARKGELRVECSADMRYVGQGYEIKVPFEVKDLGPTSEALLEEAFCKAYETLFERRVTDVPIEAVNWRMVVCAPRPDLEIKTLVEGDASGGDSVKGRRKVFFSEAQAFMETVVYDRQKLCAGDKIVGPVVVEEIESTTVIGPGEELSVDEYLNLVIRL